MILVASSTDARRTRKRDVAGTCSFHRSTFIGSDAGEIGVTAGLDCVPTDSHMLYPVAYLIELDPLSELDVHFHRANQFQVFVAGQGRLGRHAIESVTVHYAGAYTAYGPIRPGPQGLYFFTLRDAWDPGARFLPLHAEELRLARTRRREAISEALAVPDDAMLAAIGEPSCRALFAASEDDARGAWSQQLPPGAAVDVPVLAGSGGQFWLVLAGSLRLDDRPSLPRLSCVFVGSDAAPPNAYAEAKGLHLLVLRLPKRLASGESTARSSRPSTQVST